MAGLTARTGPGNHQTRATTAAAHPVDDSSDRVPSRGILIPDQRVGLSVAVAALFGFTFVHWRPPSSRAGESSNGGDLNRSYSSVIAAMLHRAKSFTTVYARRRDRSSIETCLIHSAAKGRWGTRRSSRPGRRLANARILDFVVAAEVPDGISDFWKLVVPQRITEVIDVGANPIDTAPPYTPMLAAGLCRVTGFEPQADALRTLQERKGQHERICRTPWATETPTRSTSVADPG